jgi:lipopolysaccharide/colanic/teichoic acid biosynthesis glycosyltransferase
VSVKRAFDVVVTTVLLVGGAPLWGFLAGCVWLDCGAPVFHRSVRAGRGGRPFTLLKFRTMAAGSGPGITRAGDPRITRAGRLLRRTRLDEVPQLLNVLRGDMSLVGPRPEDLRYVELYTSEQRRVLEVRPGIASEASIRYAREDELLARAGDGWERHYMSAVLPDKLAMDLSYVDRASLPHDIAILARAVACVLRP